MDSPWHVYVYAAILIVFGIDHFRNPKFYVKFVPGFLFDKILYTELVGGLQAMFGCFMCFPSFAGLASWFLIVLSSFVLIVNLFFCFNKKRNVTVPKWVLFLLIPLNLLTILWAYVYTFPLYRIFQQLN